jgi:hypothetical protein
MCLFDCPIRGPFSQVIGPLIKRRRNHSNREVASLESLMDLELNRCPASDFLSLVGENHSCYDLPFYFRTIFLSFHYRFSNISELTSVDPSNPFGPRGPLPSLLLFRGSDSDRQCAGTRSGHASTEGG